MPQLYRGDATHVRPSGQYLAPALAGEHALAVTAGPAQNFDQLHIADTCAFFPEEVLRIDQQDLVDGQGRDRGPERVVGATAQSHQSDVACAELLADQVDPGTNI